MPSVRIDLKKKKKKKKNGIYFNLHKSFEKNHKEFVHISTSVCYSAVFLF